jgi:hypothetical protein
MPAKIIFLRTDLEFDAGPIVAIIFVLFAISF